MTKLELQINGQPFEIELHDGVQVSVEDGKMVVRGGKEGASSPQLPRLTTNQQVITDQHIIYTIFGDETAFVVSI